MNHVALSTLIPLLLAGPAIAEPFEHVNGATVEAVTERPPGVSGVFAWFYRVTVRAPGQDATDVYVHYMRPDQPMPSPGEVCDIDVVEWNTGGIFWRSGAEATSNTVPDPVLAVERMQCGAKVY